MDEFLPVVFSRPLILMATSVVLFLLCVPVLIHAIAQRKKFQLLRDGEQTYSRRASIRTEFIVAGVAAFGVIACLVFGATGYNKAMNNLEANIQQEYSPTMLNIKYWNGSWATADVALSDGSVLENATVVMHENYRPVITEQVAE